MSKSNTRAPFRIVMLAALCTIACNTAVIALDAAGRDGVACAPGPLHRSGDMRRAAGRIG